MSAHCPSQTDHPQAARLVGLLQEAAFAVSGASLRIAAWNAHAEALLGYEPAEACSLGLGDLLPSGSSVSALASASGPVMLALRGKSGTVQAARISFSPLESGDDALFLAIVRPEAVPDPRVPLFRSVFERAATGIALADLNGRFIECNPAFQALVGFKQRELKHLSFNALAHPEDRITGSAPFRELIEGRRDFCEVTQRLIRKDGTILWIHQTVSLVKDDSGQALYCIAIANDITEERRAEQRATIQLTITKILADHAPANLAVVQVMQAICKTLDWQIGEFWTPDEAAGDLRRQVSWQVPGFQATEFLMFGQQVTLAAGEGLPGTVWSLGRPAWFADVLRESNFLRRKMAEQAGIKGALAFPVTSAQGILGVIVFAYRDFRQPDEALLSMMTDFGAQLGQFIVRKQAERQLKLLGAIVNSAGEAIVGLDLHGQISSWNPSAERLFGYTVDEVMGRPSSHLFPADQASALSQALARVREGTPGLRVELRALTKSGASPEVWVTPSRIKDERGGTSGFWMTVYQATTR